MSKRTVFASLAAMTILIAALAALKADRRATTRSKDDVQSNKGIGWLSHESGIQKALGERKPIMITFYADWCHYCKMMDTETFSNPPVARYLKDNLVAIKVNTDKDRGLASKYRVTGLPTTWFLEYTGTPIGPLAGYVPPDRFIKVLRYISDSHYKNMSLEAFLDKE